MPAILTATTGPTQDQLRVLAWSGDSCPLAEELLTVGALVAGKVSFLKCMGPTGLNVLL